MSRPLRPIAELEAGDLPTQPSLDGLDPRERQAGPERPAGPPLAPYPIS